MSFFQKNVVTEGTPTKTGPEKQGGTGRKLDLLWEIEESCGVISSRREE